MRLWKEKVIINAPVDHVFKCVTDFDLFEKFVFSQKDEIAKGLKEKGIKKFKFRYNQALGELTIISDHPLLKIVPEKEILNEYTSGILVPISGTIKRLGKAKIECRFTETNSKTELFTEVNSFKEPNIFTKIIIKIIISILRFQSKSDGKKFISFIEKSA